MSRQRANALTYISTIERQGTDGLSIAKIRQHCMTCRYAVLKLLYVGCWTLFTLAVNCNFVGFEQDGLVD